MAKPLAIRAMSTAHGLLDITKEIMTTFVNYSNGEFTRLVLQVNNMTVDTTLSFKKSTSLEKKKAIANTLIREMSTHGDAEEVSVYNDYASLGLKGPVVHNKGKLNYASSLQYFHKLT